MARVAAGDAGAFESLVLRTERLVFSVALRVVRNPADAEDVTAEVYTQVWQRADTFDASRGQVEAWLVMLARSRAVDRLRAASVRRHLAAASLEAVVLRRAPGPTPEQEAQARERCRGLTSALEVLSPAERQLVELAFFEGWTHTELAARLRLPLGTLKTRLRAAMIKLRAHLSTTGQPAAGLEERFARSPKPPGSSDGALAAGHCIPSVLPRGPDPSLTSTPRWLATSRATTVPASIESGGDTLVPNDPGTPTTTAP